MSSVPDGLGPAVGAALWHLQRGLSYDDTLTAMEGQRNLEGIPTADLRRALNIASFNYRATLNAERAENGTLCSAFGKYCRMTDIVGVRVLISWVDEVKGEQSASVTIDVGAYRTPAQVIQYVKDNLDSIMEDWEQQSLPPLDVEDIEVQQLIYGGFERPARTMP